MSGPPERRPLPDRPSPLSAWAIPALIALAVAVQLAAFRTGVIMPDAVAQYGQALSGGYADWHPPVMAWIWRWLGAARFGSAPMLLLDLALFWLGLGLIAAALRRTGHGWRALVPIAIGALPIPLGQMGAVLKDSLLTACLLAASGIAAWHLLRASEIRWPARIVIAGVLAIAAATRFNAPFAAAPILLLALPRPPQRVAGLIAATAVATALLFGCNVLIDKVMLRPIAQHPMLSLVNFDLAGISIDSGINAYPAAARPDPALIAVCYTPRNFNGAYRDDCDTVEGGLHALYDAKGGANAAWLAAIAAHPLAYAEHRLAHFNVNQRAFVRTVPDDAIFIGSTTNDLGLHYQANGLAYGIYIAASWLAWSPLGRPATWLALGLGLVIACRAPLPRLLALSSLLYGLGYLVVSVAPDLRYNLWTMLATMLALLLAWTGGTAPMTLIRAAVPCLIVVAGELIALVTA